MAERNDNQERRIKTAEMVAVLTERVAHLMTSIETIQSVAKALEVTTSLWRDDMRMRLDRIETLGSTNAAHLSDLDRRLGQQLDLTWLRVVWKASVSLGSLAVGIYAVLQILMTTHVIR